MCIKRLWVSVFGLSVGPSVCDVEVPWSYRLSGSKWSHANLLCAQVNSASYTSRDEKQVVAYELRGDDLVWLIGAVVCLCAAPRVQ